ncbi:MAG: AAA family ATPase [Gemmatimonadaceae bacterium]|nr:AAA family ATPase [Gemmatimonadaceae bacterium]
MTMMSDSGAAGVGADTLLPGFAVTAVTPDEATSVAAAMLIALLAHDGANVAAMVPVETGLDDPCEAGSRGALIRWAAGHLDDPRHVTPFALEADRSAMLAADASGTLLHGAAFDRAREALSDGRTVLVVADAVGLMDPITPSLTMLDLITRWSLEVLIVEPLSRWAVGHVRLLAASVAARGLRVGGVLLSGHQSQHDLDDADITAMRDTIAALLNCPVVLLPHVQSFHDRGELLTAAESCGLQRVIPRRTA